jgi:hypothetical protein
MLQGFDSTNVNQYHCVIHADDEAMKFFVNFKKSLRLLNNSKYSSSQRLLLTSLTNMDQADAPAKWVALNAVGVSMLLGGRYHDADTYLRQSFSHLENLSKQGLSQDAFADIAGCLGDLAANIIKSRAANESEAFHMLKRALYMSERAYRPNVSILQSTQSLLALATLSHDTQKAKKMADRMLSSDSMLELLCDEKSKPCTDAGAARSLGILAAVLIETDDDCTAAVRVATASCRAMLQSCGASSADYARAAMTLARAHFVSGRR